MDRRSDLAASDARTRESAIKAATTRWTRRDLDQVTQDPAFDFSPSAAAKRLERALAIGSYIVEREARNGFLADGSLSMLRELAGIYRTLALAVPADPTKLDDEALKRIAGG